MKRIISATLFAATLGSVSGAEESADMLSKGSSSFAALDGFRVHYKCFGKGKTAVVFIHGSSCDMSYWRFQVPAFADKARVVLIDLPGHGKSDKPDLPYSMGFFARAIDAVLTEEAVDKAVLVGHSLGTPVVREFWRLYPEKTTDGRYDRALIVPRRRGTEESPDEGPGRSGLQGSHAELRGYGVW
jgi:pimeloyl-ACP methyl ester carboxylesterase